MPYFFIFLMVYGEHIYLLQYRPSHIFSLHNFAYKIINPSLTPMLMACSYCNINPCKVELQKETLEDELLLLENSLDQSKKRNHLYWCFIQAEYGTLGCGIHGHVPECAIAFICSLCFSEDGVYTGHCDSGMENDNDVTSEVEGHTLQLSPSEKVKVSVSWKNSQFIIDYICRYVTNLPLQDGWHITFIEEFP